MKLYWCAKTRASRGAWMLEELGVPYERISVDIRDPSATHPQGFLAASPMGKVPALEDGEARMSESAAICLYLADRYASGTLAPKLDDPARGRFLYWLMYTPAVIEPAMSEKFSGSTPNKLQNSWGDFDSMISVLENELEKQPYITGESFTAADVMVGSSAAFIKNFGLLPESATLEAYIERCVSRPAYQKAESFDLEAD